MQHYKEIYSALANLSVEVIKTNKKISYINLPCGFDIETTSAKQGEEKIAFMYVWMVGIGHNNGVFYGRTWGEFLDLLNILQTTLGLSKTKLLPIYVHNLGYEFQFFRKYLTWEKVFSVDDRKPLKAVCDFGIEFRDSYILSGFSLANTAKNLTKHKIKKMEGDLDYKLERHHETPLTKEEMGYCENDIAIITAYIDEQIELYGDVTKIPSTNTGRVRKYVKDQCYYTSKNHRKTSKGKFFRYRQIMQDLTLDREGYTMLKRAFMGGFTHANANYVGKTLENVSSIDFTSSYPAVMLAEKFPMSRFKPLEITDIKHFEQCCEIYAMVFNIRFHNIRPRIEQENYLSESKCIELKGAIINNGRVSSATLLSTTITEIDYQIMQQSYEWDEIELDSVLYAHKNYLPKSIVQSVLNLYQDKTVLKDVEGSEVEYLLSKGMLNSIYGMCVTDVVKDNAIYEDSWGIEKVNIDEELDKYNNSKNRFLYYPWGVWVTAYARRNLWTGIIAVGNDYVYSDTDSLKILNYENHKPYIEWYDKTVMQKMVEMCQYYKLDETLLAPKTKEGKIKPIGIWDFEGTYSRFKTLGAKRYLIEKGGKLQITVAGLSKQNGLAYMLEKAGDNTGVFTMFSDSLYIPAERTGKNTHTYIDIPLEYLSTDYLGNKAKVAPKTGVHLEACDFTLSVASQFKEFLANLANGYIYKGVKHV